MSSRAPGEGRYARLEREQRWLLPVLPGHLTHPISIADRYLSGTRLRLRRMEDSVETIYKVGQKVRLNAARPEAVKLTNIYLSRHEYLALTELPAAEVRKTRWNGSVAGRRISVDEFLGHLRGLILAEVELNADEPRLDLPPFASADVTDEDRFSGGSLAHATPKDVEILLVEAEDVPSQNYTENGVSHEAKNEARSRG